MTQVKCWSGKVVAELSLLLALLVAVPQVAMALTATTIGDYDNVTVMQVSGGYDVGYLNGYPDMSARRTIAKEFYRSHGDDYDMLVIFTNFDFVMPPGAKAFYSPARNDVRGIGVRLAGQELFDYTNAYSPTGAYLTRLNGTIDMANISSHVLEPTDPEFDDTLMTLTHEFLHRWGAYVRFRDGASNSVALLGKDDAHWSYLLDSGGSTLYGNNWRDNGDGTFTSIAPEQIRDGEVIGRIFSPLDLYLMGVIDKSQVPPLLLIDAPGVSRSQLPAIGETIAGTARTITIDDIVAAEGERVPSAANSRKEFRLAFIYAVTPGTWSAGDAQDRGEVAAINRLQTEWEKRFSILTDGAAMMRTAFVVPETVDTNPGVIAPIVTPATTPSVNNGVSWLIGRQQPGGFWQDQPGTDRRDTAAAVNALKPFPAGSAAATSGQGWLGTVTPENSDFLARKLLGLSGAGIGELTALQNLDGGWGSALGYASNPVDTALALQALTVRGGATDGVLAAAVNYLHDKQNPDGGWNTGRGGSQVQPTARTLLALNSQRGRYPLEPVIADGLAWLAAKQNPDGGFGNSPSTVVDTAIALQALKATGAAPTAANSAVNYLLAKQANTGSWNDSVFQTAQAVEALHTGQVAADLTVAAADISISPYPINSVPSDAIVSVKVKNDGDAQFDQVKVALYKGDPNLNVLAGQNIVSIAGHTTTNVGFPIHFTEIGRTTFYASVDPDGVISEISEFNNVAAREFYVGPPPPTVGFSMTTSSGSEAQTVVSLAVNLAYPWDEVLTVDYRIDATGTATVGGDFTLTPGTLTFAPGETSKTVTINVINDLVLEASETIVCELYNSQKAFLGNARHTYTIIDNDQPPTIETGMLAMSGNEGTTNVEIRVNLSFASDRDVTVDYFCTPQTTATAGTDYVLPQGPLQIPAGQSSGVINLTIVNDTVPEDLESIYVKIVNPVNAVLGYYTTTRYDLEDDDGLPNVNISSPVNGQTYNTRNPYFNYDTAGSIARVEVYVDDIYRQNYTPIGPLSYGNHRVKVDVYNTNGIKATDEVSFFVDDTGLPPDLAWYKEGGVGFGKVVVGEDGGIYAKEYFSKFDQNWTKHWGLSSQIADFAVKFGKVYIYVGNTVKIYRLDGTLDGEIYVQANGSKIEVDDQGSIYLLSLVAVDMKGSTPNQYDVVVYKYNRYGKFLNKIQFGGVGNEYIDDIKVDSSGKVYVVGTTTGYIGSVPGANQGGDDFYVARISSDFDSLIVRQYGTAFDEDANELAIDSQGNVFVAATTPGTFDGVVPVHNSDAVVIKFNSDFNEVKIHQEHMLSSTVNLFVDKNDYVYLAGRYGNYDPRYFNNYTVKIIRYNNNINEEWTKNVYDQYYDHVVGDLYVDNNGNIYINAFYNYPNYSTGYWEVRSFLHKYNTGIEPQPKPVLTVTPVDEEPGRTTFTLVGTRESNTTIAIADSAGGTIDSVTYPTATTWSCAISGMTPGKHLFSISATRPNGEHNIVTYEYEVFPTIGYSTAWIRQYGTTTTDSVKNLLFNGSQLQLFGETYGVMSTSATGSDYDLFVLKTDLNGNQLPSPWQIDTTGNHLTDYALDSAIDAGGNTYLLWSNSDKGFVAKYNSSGVQVWKSSIDSRVNNNPTSLAIDQQGNVYVAGNAYASLNREAYGGGYDYFVIKFNSLGSRVWTKLSGEPGSVLANDIAVSSSGTIYLVGYETDGYYHSKPVIYKLNNSGVPVAKGIVAEQSGEATSIFIDTSGSIYVAGYANFLTGTYNDPFVVKMNDSLAVQWSRDLKNRDAENLFEIRVNSEGNIIAVGNAKQSSGGYDGYMLALASDGKPIYSRKFATSAADSLDSILIDNAGVIYLAGNTSGQMGERQVGGQDAFIAKLTLATGPELTVTAPTSPTNINSQLLRGTVSAGSSLSVSVSAPSGSTATISSVIQNLDGTWSFTVSNLVVNADNVLTVSATDSIGTTSRTVTITVDTLPPVLAVNPVTSPTSATTQTVTGTIEAGATLTVEINPPAATVPVTVTNGTWSCAASLAAGVNTLTFTATDAAGNTSVRTVTIDCRPPQLTITPASIVHDAPVPVTLTIEQFDPAVPTIQLKLVQDVAGDGSPVADPLARLFFVQDGVASGNPNVPGDEDGLRDGRIVTSLSNDYLNDVTMAPGDYVVVAETSPTAVTAPFRIVESSQSQTIQGYVLDPQNVPLSGATVQLLDKWGGSHGYAMTDSAGHYLFNVPAPGDYILLPTRENFAFARASLVPRPLAVGQQLTVDLPMVAGTYKVDGQVRDADSSAQVAGGILVRAESGQYIAAPMTRAYGSYSIDLPAGEYELYADSYTTQGAAAQGYLGSRAPLGQVTVSAASTGNHLQLKRGTTLVCGQVRDTAILGVPGLVVEATSDSGSGRFATAVTDAGGHYCLGLIDDGTWQITLNDDADQPLGYLGTTVPGVTALAGPFSDVDLTVYPVAAALAGSVREEGQPVAGMTVQATCAASGAVVTGRTAADGSYRLGVHAGPWQVALAAEALGYGPVAPAAVSVAADGTASQDFAVTRLAEPVTVTVNPVISPTAQSTQTLGGSRSSNATVTVTVNSTATVGAVSYPTTTSWQCILSNLVQGMNVITVSAADGTSQATAPVVTIDFQPPAMTNTIIITKAIYDTRKKVLTVEATSTYQNANLQAVGYGAMSFSRLFKGKYFWTFSQSMATKPATITVSGPEGSRTATVQ